MAPWFVSTLVRTAAQRFMLELLVLPPSLLVALAGQQALSRTVPSPGRALADAILPTLSKASLHLMCVACNVVAHLETHGSYLPRIPSFLVCSVAHRCFLGLWVSTLQCHEAQKACGSFQHLCTPFSGTHGKVSFSGIWVLLGPHTVIKPYLRDPSMR